MLDLSLAGHTKTRIVNVVTHQEVELVNSCGYRSCPICSKIRSRRLYGLYSPLFASLEPSKLSLLTLTFPNTKTLLEGLLLLRSSLRSFRRQKFFVDKVKGGLGSVEVTFHQGWHVHVHMLLYSDFIIRRDIINSWSRLTGGYIVDIRQVKSDPLKALNYILKYVQKGFKYQGVGASEVGGLYYVYNAVMYRVRSSFAFGIFYGLKKEKNQDWENLDYLYALKDNRVFHHKKPSFFKFSDFVCEEFYKQVNGLTF